MENETTKKVLRYTLTPQIVPRIQELFFSGFSFIAFFVAQIYGSAKLLPAGHPYLNPQNMKKYGLRHVIVEAGNNLVISKNNIDQILIYFVILIGMVMLFVQFCLLGAAIFMQAAYAGTLGPVPDTFASYFLVDDATHDVAFVILDRVFGLPDMFVSASNGTTCVAQGIPCFQIGQSTREITADRAIYSDYDRSGGGIGIGFPFPFHLALHELFRVYSTGILIIATFILTYFVIVVVAETAQSGTPFGRRFNHVWAPLRLVAAIGLLVPLTSGLNSGQYILLHAAKWGSGFATNGWKLFSDTAVQGGNTLLGNTNTLVAEPSSPPVNTLVEFFTIVATCRMAYERMYHQRTDRAPAIIEAWLINPNNVTMAPVLMDQTSYQQAMDYFDGGNIIVRYGELAANGLTINANGELVDANGDVVRDANGNFITQTVFTNNNQNTITDSAGNSISISSTTTTVMVTDPQTGVTAPQTITTYTVTDSGGRNLSYDPSAGTISQTVTDPATGQTTTVTITDANGNNITAINTVPSLAPGAAGGGSTYQTHDGQVAPLCGEVMLQITDPNEATSPGSYIVQKHYYDILWFSWLGAKGGCNYGAQYPLYRAGCIAENLANRYLSIDNDPNAPLPTSAELEEMRVSYQDLVDFATTTGVTTQRNSPEWLEQLTPLGWGGAAIWYNKVAQLNGSLIGAVYSLPAIKKYPQIMEEIRKDKAGSDSDTVGESRHRVFQGKNSPLMLRDDEKTVMAKAMFAAQRTWDDHYSEQTKGSNIFINAIHAILGTRGLFDMRANATAQIHPLAQLTAIGRTVIDSAIANLGYSAAAGLGGGIMNFFKADMVGRLARTASGMLSQLAMVGITIGFVLYYIIPLMPFIYFFFAVGGWIKGVFEAMVGIPLWALAHIRIDGEGLPGDAALGGYHLILEIFLRPILIVFGFLASLTIFAAQVQVLHEIWTLVISNTTGFDKDAAGGYDQNATGGLRFLRGAMDEFFYTVIYAIIVYMLGLSAFKLIDLIPNQILRWVGANVSTFGDQSGDPAQNLIRNSFYGGQTVTSQIGGAIGQARSATGQAGQALKGLAGSGQQR